MLFGRSIVYDGMTLIMNACLEAFDGDFWDVVCHATELRAIREGWSTADVEAAVCQASLLSYRSQRDDVAMLEWPGPGGENFRYVPSEPEKYLHNCPWNDWLPPSVSQALFDEAAVRNAAAGETPIQRRVRCRLSPWKSSHGAQLVAFASVEEGSAGDPCLTLRRGGDIIAIMTLASLRSDVARDKVLGLSPNAFDPKDVKVRQHMVYVHFDTVERMAKFTRLIS